MPFFKRCLAQSVSRIDELQVNQNPSLTNHMIQYVYKKHLSAASHHNNQGQDPFEHTPVLRLFGVLLWVSLRTRPDITWAVARKTRLASSDEALARVCSI